jgi:hypothetical protein
MQENRLSDPGDELCDEYESKYGDDERHGVDTESGGVYVNRLPFARHRFPVPYKKP